VKHFEDMKKIAGRGSSCFQSDGIIQGTQVAGCGGGRDVGIAANK